MNQDDSPYYAFKFMPKEWWWCKVCNHWHKPEEDKIYAYNVCVNVGDPDGTYRYSSSLPTFISCSKEYCEGVVQSYNKAHYRMKELSKNPHKPVML